jgi:hypothetical protein
VTKFEKRFLKDYFRLLNPRTNWERADVNSNLYQRGTGFRKIFDYLLQIKKNNYSIVETGVLRNIGVWTDGQSSFLFQEFCKYHNGSLKSVDIDSEACDIARNFLDPKIVSVTCGDSIEFLKNIDTTNVDLFYLDSYDVIWSNYLPSAEHHLKEFLEIENRLSPGTLVVIDDNTFYQKKRAGKGTLIYEYLKDKGKLPVYDDYQIIYEF